MNQIQYRELTEKAAQSRRLLENEDFQEFIKGLEYDLARKWNELKDSSTTDPHIAELQGNLRRLEEVISRAKTWVERLAEVNRTMMEQSASAVDDYDTG